jgi:hypothetical protein
MVSLGLALMARLVASTAVVKRSDASSQAHLRHTGKSFIASLEFKHKLRVCNAYPYSFPMDIYLGKEKLTDSPMAYKKCDEFTPNLKAGDKLDFRVGDSSAGSFSVSELPGNDAVLVLVIYRHDTESTSVSFESHVFSNLINSQIAVLDAYRGTTKATPRIRDVQEAKTDRNEELRYDSVVAVNPGLYEVVLQTTDGETKAKHELVALNRESYVIVRCGVEAGRGQSYPQDLMVFPHSDPRLLTGSAMAKCPLLIAVVSMLINMLTALQ